MIHDRNSLAGSPPRAYRALVQSARALGWGFVLLAWLVVAPLVRMWAWVRRMRVHVDPGPHAAPAERPPSCEPARQGLPPVRDPHCFSTRLAHPGGECVEVEPELNERHYPTVCAHPPTTKRTDDGPP